MSYSKEERETVITTDDCMDNWVIYTRQRKVMTKLLKLDSFTEKRRELSENGQMIELEGIIPFRNVSFRNLSKITEERRRELSESMKNIKK